MATIEDIKAYVRETPYNTNPNVLDSLLDSLETGGGIDLTIATISGSSSRSITYSCDKTYEELVAATNDVYFKLPLTLDPNDNLWLGEFIEGGIQIETSTAYIELTSSNIINIEEKPDNTHLTCEISSSDYSYSASMSYNEIMTALNQSQIVLCNLWSSHGQFMPDYELGGVSACCFEDTGNMWLTNISTENVVTVTDMFGSLGLSTENVTYTGGTLTAINAYQLPYDYSGEHNIYFRGSLTLPKNTSINIVLPTNEWSLDEYENVSFIESSTGEKFGDFNWNFQTGTLTYTNSSSSSQTGYVYGILKTIEK